MKNLVFNQIYLFFYTKQKEIALGYIILIEIIILVQICRKIP